MITFTPAFGIIESLNLSNTLATDAFIDAVRPEWDKLYPCTEQLVTTVASDMGGTYDSIAEFNGAADRLIAHVRSQPRGTWGFIAQRMPTNDVFIDAIISAGGGEVAIHTFTEEPTYGAILDKLQYGEIYAARQQYRALMRIAGVLDRAQKCSMRRIAVTQLLQHIAVHRVQGRIPLQGGCRQ